MNKIDHSVDGFSIRRRNPARRLVGAEPRAIPTQFLKQPAETGPLTTAKTLPPPTDNRIKRSDIDESLKKFDSDPYEKKRTGWRPGKRFFKRLFKLLLIILVLVGLYIGIKALIASSKIFGGNLFDLFATNQPLKADVNGRSNILVFGTSEDDDHEHAGASLTDSVMIISLDQKTKKAAMTSVPRDLWVSYDAGCEFGFEGKINVVYQCGAGDAGTSAHSDSGSKALMGKVGEVYGLDIQYYIHVNYTALRQAVDAVGGVDIVIESDDPRGILDRNFDWECNYQCYYVKYPNGPVHLDGKRALFLARARNDSGGYGLAGGNFDREKNQQKILVALRNKAASAGTLANPVASSQLIDSLGNNVRTNFVSGEVKTLIALAKDTKDKDIDRFNLVDIEPPLLTTGPVNGQSAVMPTAGIDDFSAIRAYIDQRLTNGELLKEKATVAVLNGSGRAGAAANMAAELAAAGFVVTDIADATVSETYGKVSVYKVSASKQPATSKKLGRVLDVKVKKSALPFGMSSTADFVVIVGQ